MRPFMSTTITILGLFCMTNLAYGFDSQGHRGTRGLMPENTLPAFARALTIGVNTLELDVGTTRDGVVVISHNPHLEPALTRDASGNWLDVTGPAIHSLTLKQLKTYDFGRLNPETRYAERFSDQAAVDGTKMPTLKELLLLIKRSGNEKVRLNIETKLNPDKPDLSLGPEEFVVAVLKVIDELGFHNRVTIQSFDWRTLQVTQRLAPDIPTSYLTVQQSWYDNIQTGQPGPSPWTAGFDIDDFGGNLPRMVKTAGGRIWSSFYGEVTADNIKQAHALGVLVKVWTVNNVDRMEDLINMGVDGIITDYPDRLRTVLERRGMPLPPQTPVSP